MTSSDLASLIDEGRRLEAEALAAMVHDNRWVPMGQFREWLVKHGPLLLSLAAAGAEMREAMRWVEEHHEHVIRDHACIRCFPYEPTVQQGFLCGRHAWDAAREGGRP
jgi:hypothetical protein